MDPISIIIPAYNEEKNIEKSIKIIQTFLKKEKIKAEIIIVNDGSTDKTKFLAKKIKNVRLISYSKNKGRGYAIRKASLEKLKEKVIFFDMDIPIQSNLSIIKQMLKELDQNHIVLASRFIKGSKIKRKLKRDFASKVYRIILKVAFPSFKVKDPDVGFKAFRKDIFKNINKECTTNRWPWDLEFLLRAKKRKLFIKELPLEWKEGKDSTLNIFSAGFEHLKSIILFRIKF